MAGVVGVLWMILQPLLFGLIGAEVDIMAIEASTIGTVNLNSYRCDLI